MPNRVYIFVAIAIFIIAGCTGSLPSGSTLPDLDGRNVTNVNVTTVGGAAPDAAATASTLVKRDASGNIAASGVTATSVTATTFTGSLAGNAASSTYAVGAKGAGLVASTQLQPGADGTYFDVTGTAEIDGIASVRAGARLTLRFLPGVGATVKLVYGPTLKLAGGVDFVARQGDVFQFLEEEPSVWREVDRNLAGDDYIFLTLDTSVFTIPPSSDRTLLMTAHPDAQEYNGVTGVITLRQGGLYSISAVISMVAPANWSTTLPTCQAALVAGGQRFSSNVTFTPSPAPPGGGIALGATCRVPIAVTLLLSAGQTIELKAGHNDSISHDMNARAPTTPISIPTFLSVTRLR